MAPDRDKYSFGLTPHIRSIIGERYHHKCQYCDAGGADHVDHIIPQARGGADSLRNYILACDRCNQRKGVGEIAPQFLALITAIADRNKDWILARIRERHGLACHTLGLAGIYVRVPKSKPPTLYELRSLQFWNNFFIDLRKRLDGAKSENSAHA